jgi:formamidopyrimidine-DNA glycosylase
MPELPEVEIVTRGLSDLIIGKTIRHVITDTERSFPNDPVVVNAFMKNATIGAVRRRAKVILITLSTNYTLMIHLKMTGQLVYVENINKPDVTNKSHTINTAALQNNTITWKNSTHTNASELTRTSAGELRFGAGHPNKSLIGDLPDRSTRVIITFHDGSKLFFNDQRKFGWMKLLPSELVAEDPFMKKVGPEPLERRFTSTQFIRRMRRRENTTIKAALLDQTVLAGVGNIYADEALWGARIHPATRVRDVSDTELRTVLRALRYVLRLSIEKGGSTDRTFVNAEGKRGSYIQFARVFRREGQPCPRCGNSIRKLRVAGRGTHVCLVCQRQVHV